LAGDNFNSLQTPTGCSFFRASPLIGCVFSSLFTKQRAIIGVRGTRVQRIKIITRRGLAHHAWGDFLGFWKNFLG
jgi:hypothetical protein